MKSKLKLTNTKPLFCSFGNCATFISSIFVHSELFLMCKLLYNLWYKNADTKQCTDCAFKKFYS